MTVRTELWIDNCHGIDIHYNEYPVEPHFNFLIRAFVPEPFQASDEHKWFEHHFRGRNRTILFNVTGSLDFV